MTIAPQDRQRRAATTAALLLHPVRMRIIQAVTGGESTTRALAQALPDIPPATLYRHLTKLVTGGLLQVAATRRIRGAVERTYALPAPVRLRSEEVANLSREDQLRLFQTFVGMLLADHRRYLDQPDTARRQEDVTFRQSTLLLSDREAQQLQADLLAVIEAARQRTEAETAATAERRRWLVNLVAMPAAMGDRPQPAAEQPPTP